MTGWRRRFVAMVARAGRQRRDDILTGRAAELQLVRAVWGDEVAERYDVERRKKFEWTVDELGLIVANLMDPDGAR